jgi:hypothetical protein
MRVESAANVIANRKLVIPCFGISVAVEAIPFVTGAVTTVSFLQLLIKSRGNHIIALLLKKSESNNN